MDNDVISDSSPSAQSTSGRPTSPREEGSPNAKCPQTVGTIIVEVHEGTLNAETNRREKGKAISGARISLKGPTPDTKPSSDGRREFKECKSGDYTVSVSASSLSEYQKATIEPALQKINLSAGGSGTAQFLVCKPSTSLRIKVLEKDTRNSITTVKVKVPKLGDARRWDLTNGEPRIPVSAGDYQVEVDLDDRQKIIYKLPEAPVSVIVPEGEERIATLQLTARSLRLIEVSPQFAPGMEELEIKYEISHLKSDKVSFQIHDCKDNVIFERDLVDAEKDEDKGVVTRTIRWGKKDQDKVNCPGHELHGKFVNPLHGPYKVVLVHPITTTHNKEGDHKLPFNVLYHSIQLEVVPWDELYRVASGADPNVKPGLGENPKIKMWLACRLNKLGFWAGPIEGTPAVHPATGKIWPDLEKAIRRFRLMHPELSGWKNGTKFYGERTHLEVKELYFDETIPAQLVDIDQPLVDALAHPDTIKKFKRELFSEPEPAAFSDRSKTTKLFIDNHRFQIAESSEFNGNNDTNTVPAIKCDRERKWLSNPHLPLRARVLLKNSKNEAVSAPEAAGEVPILWSWSDAGERFLRSQNKSPALPALSREEPSTTQLFIDQTLDAVCEDTTRHRHTTPVAAGGILQGNDDDCGAPFTQCHVLTGADYALDKSAAATRPAGVVARTYAGDAGKKNRKAHPTVKGDFDPVQGCSIVYFRPSLIAGDNYSFKVQIDPVLCGAAEPPPSVETGQIVIWRRAFVAAFVGWPLRGNTDDDGNAFVLMDELEKAAREFEPCFFDLNLSKMKREGYRIDDVFTNDDYQNVFLDNPSMDEGFKTQIKKFMGIVGNAAPTTGYPKDSLYPGDPEEIEPRKPFDDAFKRFCRYDRLISDIKTKFTADPAAEDIAPASKKPIRVLLEQANTLMRAAIGWKDSASEANVRSAGTALYDVLVNVLEPSPGSQLPWKFKPHDASAVAALTNPTTFATSKLTAAELDEILVPPPMRDEITRFASARMYAATNHDFMKGWVPWTDSARGAAQRPLESLEGQYTTTFADKLRVIFKDGRLNGDAPPIQRDHMLALRAWVLRSRLGSFGEAVRVKLSWQTDLAARRKLAKDGVAADGLVLIDYQVTKPKTINGRPFRVDGFAYGGPNGVVLLDQGLITKFYSLVAHEIAHCMFLHHWTNTDPTVWANHDHKDDNCLMSYPYPFKKERFSQPTATSYLDFRFSGKPIKRSLNEHYCYDVFKPHFCGKCNLQIRGWNIRAAGVPDQATLPVTAPPPQKPVTVRLIKGDVADGEKNASSLTAAGISYYPADGAGELKVGWNQFQIQKLPKFPTAFGYNADAAKDPNAFRVEVLDENTSAEIIHVTLEALMPQYSSAGAVTGHVQFPDDDRKKRSLANVACKKVEAGRYRSRYIRLVTDEVDRAALYPTKQGLLVTDMADGADGDADQIEILDQKVRVTYDPTPL